VTRTSGYRVNRTKIAWLLVESGAFALLLVAAHLFAAGSVIVRDTDGSVSSVILRNSAEELAVVALPAGLYASTARIEGEAVVRCRNGKVVSLGYITSGWHVWRTIRAQDCRPDAPAVLN